MVLEGKVLLAAQTVEALPMPARARVATGLYVNWDSAVKVDEEILGWLEGVRKAKPESLILEREEEAAYLLDEALKKGGGEHLISERLYQRLKDLTYGKVERRLGGNGFNMGRALLELGVRPLVSYPCRPPSIMYASPTFKVAHKGRFRLPSQAIRPGDPEYDHLAFEFSRQPELGIEATGRIIFSWDRMSSEGWFDEEFLEFAVKAEHTDVLVLAYAHLLLPAYKKRTDLVADMLEEEARRPKVHLEFGEGCRESMEYAFKRLTDGGCLDSVGMNERECMEHLGAKSTSLESLVNAAMEALNAYGLERICIHTSDYVFVCSKLDEKLEAEALDSAVKASAAQTLGGEISRNLGKISAFQRSGYGFAVRRFEGFRLILVPTYVNPSPKILTGLGDVFTAVQAVRALYPRG